MIIKKRSQSHKNLVRDKQTVDSFTNFQAQLGLGTDNQLSGATYSLNAMISRNHVLLEAAYRSSWLVGQAVDCIAEDMTKNGVTFYSDMKPKELQELNVKISELGIWECLCDTIKWARLYGGAIAVIVIDGADYEKPFNPEAIKKGSFKGLMVLDRWMLQPSFEELITDMGKDFGMPKFYRTVPAVVGIPLIKIHYSRIIRFDGIKLPYYQKLAENLWGLSVVERMFDRLLAYDSSSLGAAQLLYKAYLRVIKVKGLREALAASGKEEQAVIKMFKHMRNMQSIEGITLLDSEDDFGTHAYNFSGVSDLLIQFGQQISGATGIPLVRLFGQSPTGLSATGESDLRNYYDHINKLQENTLRYYLNRLFSVISLSELGKPLPDDFEFAFNPLWQMSDKEKAEITTADTASIMSIYGGGIGGEALALKELNQQSRITGRFTNIEKKDIKDAEKRDTEGPPQSTINEESENLNKEKKGIDIGKESGATELSEKESKEPIKEAKKEVNIKEEETKNTGKDRIMFNDAKEEEEFYRKEAQANGIIFNGMQEQSGGLKSYPLFTDPDTRTTFTPMINESVKEALSRKRKQFGKTN